MEGIKYVINYDYPNSSEDYIHRIGRTGRSDSTGTSYAFFTPSNFRQAKDLVSVLKEANQVRSIIFGISFLFWHASASTNQQSMNAEGRKITVWEICLRCPHDSCLDPILKFPHIDTYVYGTSLLKYCFFGRL